MSPDNILFRLPDAEATRIREVFDALAAAGFPRQEQPPHVTVTFAPEMGEQAVRRAGELLAPLTPVEFRRTGVAVFGTKSKQTVTWLLDAPHDVQAAAREVSAANPDGRGPEWTPHLTVGLRLPRRMVGDYIAALDEITPPTLKTFTGQRVVWRRPRLGDEVELEHATGRPRPR
ncbi:2'-5' RNA ligase family protein [Corynebacterium massiliense]|uniref:2'-5' RNA ligase family protein n=1 Tax=Corynebacterium massiliense TaxID=441501 RepID=UPI0009FBE3F9|nr:2'-5' RNA ligase family protein [Corynebacterium massiliense]